MSVDLLAAEDGIIKMEKVETYLLPFDKRMELLKNALAKETPESLKEKLLEGGEFAEIPDICFKTWPNYDMVVQRRIVSAANRFYDKETGEEIIISSARHYSPGMTRIMDFLAKRGVDLTVAHGDNQGFIDQFDDYHTREEAVIIARWADQLHYEKCGSEDELFSEDLYQ